MSISEGQILSNENPQLEGYHIIIAPPINSDEESKIENANPSHHMNIENQTPATFLSQKT
jgi:hypothetical protein